MDWESLPPNYFLCGKLLYDSLYVNLKLWLAIPCCLGLNLFKLLLRFLMFLRLADFNRASLATAGSLVVLSFFDLFKYWFRRLKCLPSEIMIWGSIFTVGALFILRSRFMAASSLRMLFLLVSLLSFLECSSLSLNWNLNLFWASAFAWMLMMVGSSESSILNVSHVLSLKLRSLFG